MGSPAESVDASRLFRARSLGTGTDRETHSQPHGSARNQGLPFRRASCEQPSADEMVSGGVLAVEPRRTETGPDARAPARAVRRGAGPRKNHTLGTAFVAPSCFWSAATPLAALYAENTYGKAVNTSITNAVRGPQIALRTPDRPADPIIHKKKHESHGQAADIIHDRDDPPSQRRPVPGPPRGIARGGGPEPCPDPPVPRQHPGRGEKSTAERHGTEHHAADSQHDEISHDPLPSCETEAESFGSWFAGPMQRRRLPATPSAVAEAARLVQGFIP